MRLGPTTAFVFAMLAGSTAANSAHAVYPQEEETRTTTMRLEFGIELALRGETVRAESAFVSVLASAPGDARALTNLGNVALLEGDLDVALAYYERALRADPSDPGIRLDRATALHMQGDAKAAETEAAVAVRAAGGLAAAAELLGIRGVSSDDTKAADAATLTQEEIASLLRRAATAVPSDSVHLGEVEQPKTERDSVDTAAPVPTRRAAWRSAGPRSEGEQRAAILLYWKRQ